MFKVSEDKTLGLEAWAQFDDTAGVYELFADSEGEDFIGNADSTDEARAIAAQYFSEEGECRGHYPGPFDPMGLTFYCDGSCRRH